MKYNQSGARLAQELLYGFLTKRMFRRGSGIILIIVPLQKLKKEV